MKVIIVFIILSLAVLSIAFVVFVPNARLAAAENVLVTKVIDGDTLVIEGGDHVRLLGIDSDEKGYPCFNAAKLGLESLVLNRRVALERESEDSDNYGRLLRWIWLNGTLVNQEMVESGLAVARFYSDSKYKNSIVAAEKEAIAGNIGCKWSSLK